MYFSNMKGYTPISNDKLRFYDKVLSDIKKELVLRGVKGYFGFFELNGVIFLSGDHGILIVYKENSTECMNEFSSMDPGYARRVIENTLIKLSNDNMSISGINFKILGPNFSSGWSIPSRTEVGSYHLELM